MAAYEKSKRVVKGMLGTKEDYRTKLEEVVDYVLFKCEDITPLALQKHYIMSRDSFLHLMNCFYLMMNVAAKAWAHGPVYKEIYQRYSSYKFDPIEGSDEIDEATLSSSERAVIDSVIRNLCCYSGKVLESFTHAEEPWLKTRGKLIPTVASNRQIYKKIIGEYFRTVKKQEQMLTPASIEKYSRKMFKQTI